MSEVGLGFRTSAKPDIESFSSQVPKDDLASIVQQMVEKDPAAARRFLEALRDQAARHRRRPVFDTLRSIGLLANLLNEATRPTLLRQRPASLADAWSAVGGYIQHGIREMDRRLDVRG